MRTALFATVFFLSAFTTSLAVAAGNEDSPYYTLPEGTKLVLKRPLTVPAGQASVFIQGGQVVPSFSTVSQYEPHCKIEMQRLSNTPRTIQPGEFTVSRIQRERSPHGRAPTTSPGLMYVLDSFERGFERYSTYFRLQSAQQPDVYRMTCQQWQDPSRARHVTVHEINQTLGDLFSLQRP